jgi:hypothetical protein
MGFFQLFSRHKNKSEDIQEAEASISINKEPRKAVVKLNTKSDRLGFIKDNCEIYTESERQIEEAKKEYSAVTSYLTDMQKIDLIPLEQRGDMEDAARNIYNLSKERSKLQNRSSLLSDQQYRLFERYELQIPKDLLRLFECEKYQSDIKQDMEHLDQERLELKDQEEDIIGKQTFLKGIAITTSIIIIILFLLFAILGSNSKTSFTIPFLLTVLMGMATALYIFLESRKNQTDIKLVEMKQNRQIMLMNKVKIKSVNNRNYLEYAYGKYMVENAEQFKVYWEEYVRLKDEARRYQNNTDLLEFYNNELIHELKKFKIADAEIWIFQPTAILDNKEMVEVRHRLNVRRQKLRERIEINTKQKEEAKTALQTIMETYPDCAEEGRKIQLRYRID